MQQKKNFSDFYFLLKMRCLTFEQNGRTKAFRRNHKLHHEAKPTDVNNNITA